MNTAVSPEMRDRITEKLTQLAREPAPDRAEATRLHNLYTRMAGP